MAPKKRTYDTRTEEGQRKINEALEEIRSKRMSIRQASEAFNIKRSTLSDYNTRKAIRDDKSVGGKTLLTQEEEKVVVNIVEDALKRSLAITKESIIEYVSNILKDEEKKGIQRKLPSTYKAGCKPGAKWYKGLTKRNNFAIVTEELIRQWFSDLKSYIAENELEDVMGDPSRIFNLDETGARLSEAHKTVVAVKGWKNVQQELPGSDHQSITVLTTIQAEGKLAPSMVILPYARLAARFEEEVLMNGVYANSTSGWINKECFYN